MEKSSIKQFFVKLFGKDNEAVCVGFDQTWQTLQIKELYFKACVKMIANAISVCEFNTLVKGKEIKADEYYTWNLKPNKNQTAAEFKRQLMERLLFNNEALIIENGGDLFVADSFNRDQKGFDEAVFKSVSVGGKDSRKNYRQSDVIYIELADSNIKDALDGIFSLYADLFNFAASAYKNEAGNKALFYKDAAQQGNEEELEKRRDALQKSYDKFCKLSNGAMIVPKGYRYESLAKSGGSGEGGQKAKDIRGFFDDIATYTATAFSIPPVILLGKVENTENAMTQLLSLCINPLTRLISEAINQKRYDKKDYLIDTKIFIDTKHVRHIDIFDIASAIDKLVGSGSFSINDIRKATGESELSDSWASWHFLTKNYSRIEEIAEPL